MMQPLCRRMGKPRCPCEGLFAAVPQNVCVTTPGINAEALLLSKDTRSGAGASLCCNLDVSSATARREAYTSTSNIASPWRKWAEEVHSSRQYDFHLQVLARLVDLRVSCRSGSTLEFPDALLLRAAQLFCHEACHGCLSFVSRCTI